MKEGYFPEQPPNVVLALAKQAATESVPNPIPIKWRDSQKDFGEEEGQIVVVFEDGRCLYFQAEAAQKIVDKSEAATAPLQKIKKKRDQT